MTTTDWVSSGLRAAAVERKLTPGKVLFHRGSKPVGLYEVDGEIERRGQTIRLMKSAV